MTFTLQNTLEKKNKKIGVCDWISLCRFRVILTLLHMMIMLIGLYIIIPTLKGFETSEEQASV